MPKTIKANRIVINGEWDGEVIWRFKTASEILLEALAKQNALKQKKVIKININ